MKNRQNSKKSYHHGNLAESLLDAVDYLATQFGLEAVTLRGCAKHVGVAPSSAFRHYADKRSLLTAFAAKALHQLSDEMNFARVQAESEGKNAFSEVGLAYVRFALEKPAFFRAMWREESIYSSDPHYCAAAEQLGRHLRGGFADTIEDSDGSKLSPRELLAWSAVHGLANLFVDGPIGRSNSIDEKLGQAREMIREMGPVFS